MATQTTNGRVEKTAARGFGPLPCPCCGAEDAGIFVELSIGTLHCPNCDTDFTVEDVKELIRKWTPVLAWLDTMPAAR